MTCSKSMILKIYSATLCDKRLNVEKLEPDIEKVYLNIYRGISMYKKIKK